MSVWCLALHMVVNGSLLSPPLNDISLCVIMQFTQYYVVVCNTTRTALQNKYNPY